METVTRLSLAQAMPPPLLADSYQTWDSRVLPITIADTNELPSTHSMHHLIQVYDFHCGDQFRFIDRQDFVAQLKVLETADLGSGTHANSSSFLCRLYLLLAIGCLHLDRATATQFEDQSGIVHVETEGLGCPGLSYFARAMVLLAVLERSSEVASVVCLSLAVCYSIFLPEPMLTRWPTIS